MNESKKCIFCGRGILSYKKWRDWGMRDTHYTCWKRKQNEIACKNMLEDYQKETPNNLFKMGVVQRVEVEGKNSEDNLQEG